uniref:Fucosyltransferase n=1 Tax=Rhabditophanes sp. KR3021 TaxID=114890 RepID=A0AC35TTW8_9BILA
MFSDGKNGNTWADNFFNLTYTFSTKSDVQKRYGGPWVQVINKKKTLPLADINWITNAKEILKYKDKTIIWTNSDCVSASEREITVQLLKKFIKVHQFGACTYNRIEASRNSAEFKDIYERYYFYLALENSDCEDYVTEKYWHRSHFNSIPIVGMRKYYKGAPPHSFIAMDDFNSPQQLGIYLRKLISNRADYLKFFEYRKHNWNIIDIDRRKDDNFCSLCKQLVIWKRKNKKFQKTYHNARSSFLTSVKCNKRGFVWRNWFKKMSLKEYKQLMIKIKNKKMRRKLLYRLNTISD